MMKVTAVKEVLEGPPAMVISNGVTANLIADLHCQLGEGILYDDDTDTILFTDILGKRFHKLHLSSGSISTFQVPKMLTSFAMLPHGQKGYLCAWEDGFQLYDIQNGKPICEMSVGEDVNPTKLPTRLNDGRCDREGRRFICGGFNGDIPGTTIKVYKCEYLDSMDLQTPQLTHEPIVDKVEVTNSICFSLNGNTMYMADSPTQQIHSYTYDKPTGLLSNKTWLHTKPSEVPDGSCVDKEGFLWNAVWRSGVGPSFVHRIHPTSGEIVFTVHMPDTTSQVSCCCFGGMNLDVLFITTAAVSTDSSKEKNAGGLYAVKLGFQGLKEARFLGH